MQLMSWSIARLGSRFGLLFEPYKRQVRHSALGRFLDEPLDLAVGIEGPDGQQRVLPFTAEGELFHTMEQFERANSITFRAFSADYNLRFELNIHSVFYPQDESLCLLPAIYLEMRINPAGGVRWTKPKYPSLDKIKLFLRINRANTQIDADSTCNHCGACLNMTYENRMQPTLDEGQTQTAIPADDRVVGVTERIVSLNEEAVADADGKGMSLTLPITEQGSGTKWRLVWGAFCGDPVLTLGKGKNAEPMKFKYTALWKNLDAVIKTAVEERDDRLARSRNFEKILEQAPLRTAQRHLLNQSFQQFLSNTFWCERADGTDWFSVWEGSCFFHSTIDVEYNVALLYLTLWPRLLAIQFDQWSEHFTPHKPSRGAFLHHDMGLGMTIAGQGYNHDMPVEENANFLLLLQVYAHWTGDLSPVRRHEKLWLQLANYLQWTDRDASGFPSEGTANTIDDATPAQQYVRKQTYLAVKRLAALSAASELLTHLNKTELAKQYENQVHLDVPRIEEAAWRGDHFATCIDPSAMGLRDAWTHKPLGTEPLKNTEAYSIYTANALLLPAMCGRPWLLNTQKLIDDMVNSLRETLGRYGCGHNDAEPENVWVSQNLWRDHLMRYLGATGPNHAQGYWDMQVMSNTANQSFGFIDTYVNNNLSFYPRGIVSIGYLLSYPRLIIDRLASDGVHISVDPDRTYAQRWPLLPLADWKAGKVPVCVVDCNGNGSHVVIETAIESVIVRGDNGPEDTSQISGVNDPSQQWIG